jgi:hypothetical protein
MHVATINMYMIDLKDRIIEATNSDQQYLQIKQTLQQAIYNRNLNIMS